ncbi:MAG TPA: hypothetical protein VHF25_10860 [Nitriliruptorales bacterium]|nr:hypothetical protein [Nitriliruptorales bacterium]
MTVTARSSGTQERLEPITGAVADAFEELERRSAVPRVWDRDHTLWQDDPAEVSDRLGWLALPGDMQERVGELTAFADEVSEDGYSHVVVTGMGGSSLFPDVLARSFPPRAGRPRLRVLDSTDPATVQRCVEGTPLDRVLLVAASKSGTTIETRSHLAHFWQATGGRAEQFVAITDPGTELAKLARERGFRRLFENRPDIGGRYSALSDFGLVPAALAGIDIAGMLASAARMAAACTADVPVAANPAARLGAVIAAAARAGRNKLTLVLPPPVAAFGLWVEQLVAESTGKHGTGVLPVVGEQVGVPDVYGDDRLFVSYGQRPGTEALASAGHPVVQLPLGEALDLGADVFRWEMAIALAGALLDVNPFDQPDVDSAKAATSRVLERGVPSVEAEPLGPLLEQVRPGDYLALLIYVDPAAPVVEAVERSRVALRDRLRVATTVGIGPRYLHSTGQLHKGGPPTGVFAQVVCESEDDMDVPGRPYTFATLLRAQAVGDLQTLRERGLRARRVALDELLDVGD